MISPVELCRRIYCAAMGGEKARYVVAAILVFVPWTLVWMCYRWVSSDPWFEDE